MDNLQQLTSDFEKKQFDLNQQGEMLKTTETNMFGHEAYDQRNMADEQQQPATQLPINVIQKFDGHGDPQQWLKYILEKFELLQISLRDRLNLIPEILTGEAFIWYVQEQERMPTFITFTKKFIQHFYHHDLKIESSSPHQKEIAVQSDNVMDCLKNQILITNLQKLPKFAGISTQNVFKWLKEVQEIMNIFKLTDNEKLFYIPLCLEDNARDWFRDNKQSCSTWSLFTKNLSTIFESSGKADISFNRLRHYEQSINQNVRQYYFDIMKLCKDANPLMDEATKLQYLKDGLKTSLRFDVLLKNPQTTGEFLQYAQKIEELKLLDTKQNETNWSNEYQFTSSPVGDSSELSKQSYPSNHPNSFRQTTTDNPQNKLRYTNNTQRPASTNAETIKNQHQNDTPKPPYQCYKCGANDHYIRHCPHFQ